MKAIDHKNLLKKSMQLVQSVRKQTFSENNFSLTCSVGGCFLPENISGYNYDQLFENADWALYRAKEKGKNRYAFCDNLKQFEAVDKDEALWAEDIDARYLRNDIVSTAFEIFEKMNSFNAAMGLLLKVIGIRLHLDRITVVRTNVKRSGQGASTNGYRIRRRECLERREALRKRILLHCFRAMTNMERRYFSMIICLCIQKMQKIF